MNDIADLKEKILSEFGEFENSLNGEKSSAIHTVRKEAKNVFESIGFPINKTEEWKYTNPSRITNNNFHQDFSREDTLLTADKLAPFLIPGLDLNILVLLDGKYSKRLSKVIDGGTGETFIGSFREGTTKFPGIAEKHFAKYASYSKEGFTALNTAFADDGAMIYVPDNTEIKNPVLILNLSVGEKGEILAQPRNLIIAGRSSNVTIIESYHSLNSGISFTNSVTEILAQANSNVNYYKFQNENDKAYNVGTTQVMQERDSRFISLTVTNGSNITRNNLNICLNGEGSECVLNGLYLLSGNQHVDNHTFVDHAVPNCHSDEHYKGILDDNSTGVFSGKILVRQDAQKTNAYQTNNNILLTQTASINSKPQLEIFADDVKCSHGATTGQINQEELFYLRSRGIGKKEATGLLLYAFAGELLDVVKNDKIRERFDFYLKKIFQYND